MRSRVSLILGVAILAVLAVSPATHAGRGSEKYNELLETGTIYDDEDWQQYVQEVGERVLAQTPHRSRTYTFVLLDDTMINAFTMGDEYVFLSRGLLAYFTTEDQLAAVIGHEIGHVVGRHSSSRQGRNRFGQVLGWLGFIATSSPSMLDLANTLTAAASAGYGRGDELEADAFGLEWISGAGYNPQASIEAIQILRDDHLFQTNVMGRPTQYHGIFRSHPEHMKRIHDMHQQVDAVVMDSVDPPVRDYLEMIDGMVFGENAATGVVKDNRYYHSGYRVVVSFPKGWEVGNSRSEVMGRPTNQNAYISMKRQKPPEVEQTPKEYVTQTLKRDDVENGVETTIGEYPAFIADVKVAEGDVLKRKIAVVYKDGGVYLFRGELGPKDDVEAFEKTFEAVVRSFRAMDAADQKVASTRRVVVVEARPGDTFAKLAVGAPISGNGEEMLRVINGRYPNGEPRAGDLIKLIR